MSRSRSPILAVFALGILLGGCGSYTKADFEARAGAICVAAVRQERSLPPPSFTGSAADRTRSLAGYLRRELPIVESEARQLRRLPRPAQSRRNGIRLAAYLAALRTAVADFRNLSAAAASGSREGVAAAESALGASPVSAAADAYGLSACALPQATGS